ncbi:response regulator [Alsobacter sp. KACC 23698]|uniref:Response regulator n=1 Tax=Alsobacter sp. KACC 23698 TaxID=3149229 RepID=A0AAU7JLE9_9HYPH
MATTYNEPRLDQHRILVVEDENLIALDLAHALRRLGAEVIGPAASVSKARALISDAKGPISMAILDINLHGELVFPLAEELRARQVPFLFASGYAQPVLPERYANVPIWGKPLDSEAFAKALAAHLARKAPKLS